MPTDLEALAADTDFYRTVARALGDTIIYTPAGETIPASIVGFVEYPEETFNTGNGAGTGQAITVELSIVDVPVKPDKGARIVLPTIFPDDTFSPASAIRSDAGTEWVCTLKRVA